MLADGLWTNALIVKMEKGNGKHRNCSLDIK